MYDRSIKVNRVHLLTHLQPFSWAMSRVSRNRLHCVHEFECDSMCRHANQSFWIRPSRLAAHSSLRTVDWFHSKHRPLSDPIGKIIGFEKKEKKWLTTKSIDFFKKTYPKFDEEKIRFPPNVFNIPSVFTYRAVSDLIEIDWFSIIC